MIRDLVAFYCRRLNGLIVSKQIGDHLLVEMLPAASSCMNCGEGGHLVGKCPVLRSPLKEGFYSGGGGGGGHSHDDDEKVTAPVVAPTTKPYDDRKYATRRMYNLPA
jgi:hypothetical protein